jgi:hypothetical protein
LAAKRRGKRPENAGERPNSDEIKPADSRARKRALVLWRFWYAPQRKAETGDFAVSDNQAAVGGSIALSAPTEVDSKAR